MNTEVLEILKRLEDYRNSLENGESVAGTADHIIRMCQAKAAQGYFKDRNEWKELIKE